METNDVTLTTPDGPMRAYEADPGDAAAAVVVIPEAFGLNAHIEDVTRRIADAGFLGLALDMFHRSGGGTAEYGDWSRVMELFAGIEGDDDLLADVDAGLDHLRRRGVADDRIGIVGFCFGGRVSFLVASRREIGAGVGFYGGGIVTQGMSPAFPPLIDAAPSLAVPWLGLFGDDDQSIPVDDVEKLRAELTSAPSTTEVVRYSGAGHGFHCDVREEFHAEAAADAWQRTIAFFGSQL